MTTLLISMFVFLQSVISIKPGFIDVADGKSNVQKYEHVPAGKMIQTGEGGHVEIGLGWESLLRLDENSSAVLESADRSDVAVRIQSGSAVLEVPKLDKPNQIRISMDGMTALIDSKGVFHFSANRISVTDGKLKINGSITVQKGWQVVQNGGEYQQAKLSLTTPPPFKSFLNSPKAGFVNAIQGQANVRINEVAREDQPVQTGPASYVELLLCPGAFMRVDENSKVVIDSSGLSDVVVQVVSGSALVESIANDSRFPIRVNVAGNKLLIASSGVYRFTSDTASVIDGALRIGPKTEAAYDGTLVKFVNKQYETEDLPDDVEPTGLDLWSAERSHQLARANFMSDYGDSYPNFFLYASPVPYLAAWIYSPSLNGFTFVPMSTRESHYKNSFVPLYLLIPNAPPSGPLSIRVPRPTPPPPPSTTPAPRPTPPANPAPTQQPTSPAPTPPPETK